MRVSLKIGKSTKPTCFDTCDSPQGRNALWGLPTDTYADTTILRPAMYACCTKADWLNRCLRNKSRYLHLTFSKYYSSKIRSTLRAILRVFPMAFRLQMAKKTRSKDTLFSVILLLFFRFELIFMLFLACFWCNLVMLMTFASFLCTYSFSQNW